MSVTCLACSAGAIRTQAEPASMERYVCSACGEQMYVHCNYDVDLPHAQLSTGLYANSGKVPAAKAFILLMRILASCEHFRPSRLEAQYLRNDMLWNLGNFHAFEVERIAVEAARHDLEISFVDAAL